MSIRPNHSDFRASREIYWASDGEGDRDHLNAPLESRPRGTELLRWLIFASIGCVALAIVAWPAKRLTPRAPTRTV